MRQLSSPARVGCVLAFTTAAALQCGRPTAPDTSGDVLGWFADARVRLGAIVVVVEPDSIAVGGRASATAVLRDVTGAELDGVKVSWTSDNTAVVRVDRSSGIVTGVMPGQARIIASAKGRRGEARVFVVGAPIPPPSPAVGLMIVTQPGGSTSGALVSPQPVVHAVDSNGHRVAGYTGTVTAGIASGQGTLSGATRVSIVDGAAVFTDLVVTGTGTFTLSFAADALPPVVSAPFTITNDASTPLARVTFDGYTSTAQLLADCVTFDCVEGQIGNGGAIALDAAVAPPGGRQSMRYAFTHPGDGCNSITVKRAFRLPQREQEVWAEFVIRFSTNFSTANPLCVPNAHKLIFGDTEADQSGRWALLVGNDSPPDNTIAQERPYPNWGDQALNMNADPTLLARDLWDGNWHTLRLHIRHSSSTTSADGIWEIWIDGVKRHRQTGFNTSRNDGTSNPDYITGFSFTHNKDDGPPNTTMFIWWGPITVYGANPGW